MSYRKQTTPVYNDCIWVGQESLLSQTSSGSITWALIIRRKFGGIFFFIFSSLYARDYFVARRKAAIDIGFRFFTNHAEC